jgi:hypothetical protein
VVTLCHLPLSKERTMREVVMGKKTGKKRYDKYFIEIFFKKPWCPLFGWIFWNDEPLAPSSQTKRCFNIIQEARRLWQTEDSDGIDRSDGWRGPHSWPEPEEIPDYPKDFILAAREIGRCWMSIYQYCVIETDEYYKKENGDYLPRHTLDTVWDKAIVAKSICHTNYFDKDGTLKPIHKFEDIPGFKILAIFAIKEAHWALRLIIQEGETEDNPKVMKSVQIAGLLLARAKEENLRPRAEALQKGTKKQIRSRKLKAQEKRILWSKIATDLGKKFPKITLPLLTDRVCEKLKEKLVDDFDLKKSRQSVYRYILEIFPERKQKKS